VQRGLRTISLISYLVFIFYGLFNHHLPLKYDVHRFYVERCLNASSSMIPEAFTGRSNGSVRRHYGHSLQHIFSSSCSLIKYSSTALLLLYLSGDLELNPGRVERSRANLRHSLRLRCSTCNLVFRKNVGYVTCSECTHPFHLNCIGPQFEKFRSCLNCSVVSSTADFDRSGVFQDIPELSLLTSFNESTWFKISPSKGKLSTSQS